MYCPNAECPDFLESGIPAEFVDGITKCPKCGEYLVDSLPSDFGADMLGPSVGPPAAEPDAELEPVFESWDPSEIPIVKAMLEAAGIPCVIEGAERFDAFRGGRSPIRYNPRAGSVIFLVESRLAEDARVLLEEVETLEEFDGINEPGLE
jgi:hypothetical protein